MLYPDGRLGAAFCAGLMAASLAGGAAHAQTAPSTVPGWTFNVAPYLWLPSVDATLRYALPGSSGATQSSVSVDAQTLLEDLHFAGMIAVEARNGPLSVTTDIIYLDMGASESSVQSVDFVQVGRNPVSSSLNQGTETTMQGLLWSVGAGYTVAQGSWGNVDVAAGFRLFSVESTTNVQLTLDVTGPRQGQSFARNQRLSESVTLVDGVVGLRGRLDFGSGFSLPYSFDVGAGASRLTWQAAAGLKYQTGWVGVTLGYRYLYYDMKGDGLLQDFGLGGPFLAVNFTF